MAQLRGTYLQVNFPDPISGALRVKCDNGNEVINVSGQDVGYWHSIHWF